MPSEGKRGSHSLLGLQRGRGREKSFVFLGWVSSGAAHARGKSKGKMMIVQRCSEMGQNCRNPPGSSSRI